VNKSPVRPDETGYILPRIPDYLIKPDHNRKEGGNDDNYYQGPQLLPLSKKIINQNIKNYRAEKPQYFHQSCQDITGYQKL